MSTKTLSTKICFRGCSSTGRRALGTAAILAVLVALALPALSQVQPTSYNTTYEVQEINVPDSTATYAQGINRYKAVAGYATGVASQQAAGFVFKDGTYRVLIEPHADGSTRAFGINDSHEVVGDFLGKDGYTHGFLQIDGKFTQYDLALGSGSTSVFGVNNNGAFVGTVGNEGFVNIGGTVTKFYGSGTDVTYANAINNSNQVVGQFQDSSGNWHGLSFDVSTRVVTPINYPGAVQTVAVGINDAGVISGWYQNSGGINVSFVEANGIFETVDFFSDTNGINNAGSFVGTYNVYGIPSDPNPQTYSYLATPHPIKSVTKISVPHANSTSLYGVNNTGHIVGSYTDASGTTHGLLIVGSKRTTIDYTGSVAGSATVLYGINDSDVIVGAYNGQGFSYSKGVFVDLNPPNLDGGSGPATAISNSGLIAGWGNNPELDLVLGFYYNGSTYGSLGDSNDLMNVGGINDSGMATIYSVNFDYPVFYVSSSVTDINSDNETNLFVPGASATMVGGINNLGDIVFSWDGGIGTHSAILINSTNTYYVFDVNGPGGGASGLGPSGAAYGINDTDLIVGSFQRSPDPVAYSGFMVQF